MFAYVSILTSLYRKKRNENKSCIKLYKNRNFMILSVSEGYNILKGTPHIPYFNSQAYP